MENKKSNEKITNWNIYNDANAVAVEAANRILSSAAQAISERGVFRLVLAGGHTPEAAYRLLVDADTDWSRWEIYFGDERCLPVNDPERNSIMADNIFLNAVSIPSANVYPMNSEKGAETAAKEYVDVVKDAMPFDVVLLGIGEDGHTGSLFPGQKHPADELVHPVHHSPKLPSDRVTMSVRALSNAQEVLVLATGEGKQDAIKAWKEGKPVPVSEIGNPAVVNVLMDKEAAAKI